MTVCAAVLCKDEYDIIEFTIRHLLDQVDHVIAVDNGSSDGTRETLVRLGSEPRAGRASLDIWDDEEVGYYQSAKMTQLAEHAREAGHDWFIPCDADEYWFSPFGRLADVIPAVVEREPLTLFFSADLLNHVTTGEDDAAVPDPFTRIGYRLAERNALPKVACRLVDGLRIGMGNHDAVAPGIVRSGGGNTIPGELVVHHFPWRSEEQFLRKITNGSRAYAATNLHESFGEHWRQFGLPEDLGFEDRVRGWFREWGYREDPAAEGHPGGDLLYDPAVHPSQRP
jgi:hypothetical protein